MNIRRWNQIWIYLSLDITQRFRGELLLPAVIGAEQKTAIRSRLREFVLEREPVDAGIVSLFKTVDPDLSSDAETVFLWGEHIFLFSGPDRIAETIWLHASRWLQHHRASIAQDWVYDLTARITTEQHAQTAQLEEKLAQVRSEGLSEWDSEWVERSHGELDPVFVAIELISNYNSFLANWNRFCNNYSEDKLLHLFAVGVEVAKQSNFSQPVPFPDSWRLRTERFLLANGEN